MVDDNQALRQRIQHLIDGAPIAHVEAPLIDSWMQQIRLALIGHGAKTWDYTHRLNDISWGAHADVNHADTQVPRAVQLLAEIRTAIDRGAMNPQWPSATAAREDTAAIDWDAPRSA
jgi:hypothetical protein